MTLTLKTLPGAYAVYRYAPHTKLPADFWQQPFLSVVQTPDELSVVAPADFPLEGVQAVEPGWAALKVAGRLDFSLIGVLAGLSGTLAAAGVSIFALSTFDTDYLLVKQDALFRAVDALLAAGYVVDGQRRAPAPAEALTTVRRHDRAIYAEDWMITLLARAEYGVLSTCQEGWPFSVTRNFVYDRSRHCIYLHGARKGRTFENVRHGARATFNVSEPGRLLPAERAMNMSTEYSGVVIFGHVALVDDPVEATEALHALAEKYFPHLQRGEDYEPVSEADLKVTAVLRLDIEAWSGKQKKVAEDFPGAFRFEERV